MSSIFQLRIRYLLLPYIGMLMDTNANDNEVYQPANDVNSSFLLKPPGNNSDQTQTNGEIKSNVSNPALNSTHDSQFNNTSSNLSPLNENKGFQGTIIIKGIIILHSTILSSFEFEAEDNFPIINDNEMNNTFANSIWMYGWLAIASIICSVFFVLKTTTTGKLPVTNTTNVADAGRNNPSGRGYRGERVGPRDNGTGPNYAPLDLINKWTGVTAPQPAPYDEMQHRNHNYSSGYNTTPNSGNTRRYSAATTAASGAGNRVQQTVDNRSGRMRSYADPTSRRLSVETPQSAVQAKQRNQTVNSQRLHESSGRGSQPTQHSRGFRRQSVTYSSNMRPPASTNKGYQSREQSVFSNNVYPRDMQVRQVQRVQTNSQPVFKDHQNFQNSANSQFNGNYKAIGTPQVSGNTVHTHQTIDRFHKEQHRTIRGAPESGHGVNTTAGMVNTEINNKTHYRNGYHNSHQSSFSEPVQRADMPFDAYKMQVDQVVQHQPYQQGVIYQPQLVSQPAVVQEHPHTNNTQFHQSTNHQPNKEVGSTKDGSILPTMAEQTVEIDKKDEFKDEDNVATSPLNPVREQDNNAEKINFNAEHEAQGSLDMIQDNMELLKDVQKSMDESKDKSEITSTSILPFSLSDIIWAKADLQSPKESEEIIKGEGISKKENIGM